MFSHKVFFMLSFLLDLLIIALAILITEPILIFLTIVIYAIATALYHQRRSNYRISLLTDKRTAI